MRVQKVSDDSYINSMTVSATAATPITTDPPIFGGGLMGPIRALRRDPIGVFGEALDAHGDVVALDFPIAHHRATLIRRPEHIHHVLVENHANYGKQTSGIKALRRVIGNGLVTSEGDFWRRQRRIAQPSFHHKRIAGLAKVMGQCAEDLSGDWAQLGDGPHPIDHAMMQLTLRIAGLALLGVDVGASASAVGPALTTLLAMGQKDSYSAFLMPLWVPTARNRRFKEALAVLDELVYGIIAARRTDGDAHDDLLQMLVDARDEETGEGMSDQQLRDEVMTMFLAGHETTANALTWTWWLLHDHPEVAARLRQEADDVLGGCTATFEDLPRLEYTERVIKESMRVRPPVWMTSRSVNDDDEIDGFRIPAGSRVLICPYFTHRHPELWPDPDRFDPDRFAPELVKARPKHAYLPFGAGPRICIGNAFAMMEAKIILATLVQRFELTLADGVEVVPEPVIVLRPKGGLPMHVRARS